MRDIDRAAHVLAIGELANRLQVDLRRLTKALKDSQAWPTSGSGERVKTSTISNPTEQMALGVDPARQALEALDRALVHVLGEMRALDSMRTTWVRNAHTGQQSDGLGVADTGCVLMAQVGTWEPVHRTSDCGGVLSEPLPVGRWAYDFMRATGRRPTVSECDKHARGLMVRASVRDTRNSVRL